MRDKYLPIGSVVLLNGGNKKLMITGFCTVTNENPDVMYDYCGCIYPEGVIRSDQNCVFNHDQIKELFFLGFDSDEEIAFKNNLYNFLNSQDDELEISEDNTIERLDDTVEKLDDTIENL